MHRDRKAEMSTSEMDAVPSSTLEKLVTDPCALQPVYLNVCPLLVLVGTAHPCCTYTHAGRCSFTKEVSLYTIW